MSGGSSIIRRIIDPGQCNLSGSRQVVDNRASHLADTSWLTHRVCEFRVRDKTMNVSGILVVVPAERLDAVMETLGQLPGIDVLLNCSEK